MTQQNRKSGDKDETIHYIINECNKLTQGEIPWKLCQILESDDADKWFMHKTEYILENESNKILCDLKTRHNY